MVEKQHIKSLVDILDYVASSIGRNLDDATTIDAYTMDGGYERVYCRFADGRGIAITFDVDEEGGE